MLLFLLTSHLNSICISDRSNHVLNSLHHSPQENTSIPDVTQWPTHKLHKNILFLCQMENYLFSSGSCCMIVELWKLCNVLMIISIMYFFFWWGTKHLHPVERQIVWNELCRLLFCLIPPLFSSSRSLVLAFLFHPTPLCFCQSLHLSSNTLSVLVYHSLLYPLAQSESDTKGLNGFLKRSYLKVFPRSIQWQWSEW